MAPAWRAVGLNYIRYSKIAAECVRKALKPELRNEAAKRADYTARVTQWENGKAGVTSASREAVKV